MAIQKQQEEAAMLAEMLRQQEEKSGKRKKNLTASERIAQNAPELDYSTYQGKMKILRDMNEGKIKMPKDFPTLDEVLETPQPPISINYQKTKDRRVTIDAKRNRIQDKFLDDAQGKQPTFRKTTRDYHVEKEHMKLLHGAPIGRYNPSYDRVWSKAPQIQIAGVKDRFGYGSKFSPNYVKPAEGQASAAGGTYYKNVERSFSHTGNQSHFKTMPSSRDAKNKTTVQFNRGLSNSES